MRDQPVQLKPNCNFWHRWVLPTEGLPKTTRHCHPIANSSFMTQLSQTNLQFGDIPAILDSELHGSGLQYDQSISRIHPGPAAITVRPCSPVPRM
jgi:hypothetical protein